LTKSDKSTFKINTVLLSAAIVLGFGRCLWKLWMW